MKGAIIFILDSPYLKGLQAFLYSLRYALYERIEDIVVLTNDKKIHDNDFVNLIADRIILLSDEDIGKLKEAKKDKVKKTKRIESVGKYTFLKFFVFSDLGYDYHLFFDVDMVCLNKNFRFKNMIGDYDFAGANATEHSYLEVNKSLKTTKKHRKYLFNKIKNDNTEVLRRLNSGVLFIGSKLINDDFVDKLINEVVENAYSLEQHVTFKLVKDSEAKIKNLPVFYNFTYLAAKVLGEKQFKRLSEDIIFLHYNRHKPWNLRNDWVYEIWHGVYNESLKYNFTELVKKEQNEY